MNTKNSTMITESQLKRLVFEAYMKLREDGAFGGDAATPGATSDSGDRQGQFTVPFGGVQRRKIGNGKDHDMTEVDMSDALARHNGKGGSISIPKKRVGESYMRVKVGDLREASETKQEFKPIVFGDKESEKINKSAYADIKKATKDYDGGLVDDNDGGESSFDVLNGGRGMQDLQYDSISQPFSDNVKSQIKGYANKQAEKEHGKETLGNATNKGNERILKAAENHSDAVKSGRTKASEIGLTGREVNKKDYDNLRKNVFESKEKLTVLSFKREKFINESHMLSRIPDEYKKEGKKFVMKDNAGNEYLVEWSNSEPNVKKKANIAVINEEKNRMRELWGYKPGEHESKTTNASRLHESDEQYREMMDKARKLWNK